MSIDVVKIILFLYYVNFIPFNGKIMMAFYMRFAKNALIFAFLVLQFPKMHFWIPKVHFFTSRENKVI